EGERLLRDDLDGAELLVLVDGAVGAEVEEALRADAVHDDVVVRAVRVRRQGVVARELVLAGRVEDVALDGLDVAEVLLRRGLGAAGLAVGGGVFGGGVVARVARVTVVAGAGARREDERAGSEDGGSLGCTPDLQCSSWMRGT